MMKRVALLIAATAFAIPAQAQEAALDPDHIVTVLKDAGYPAEYFNDDADYRQILSKSGNYQFLVELYECTDSKACKTIEFYSNFPMEEPPTKERIDAYSGPREDARISINRQGTVVLRQELALSGEAGLTDEQFLNSLKTWETIMTGFAEYLHEQAPEAPAAASAAAAPAGDAADAS